MPRLLLPAALLLAAAPLAAQTLDQSAGYGAVFAAARVIDEFRRELAGESGRTFNPALVLGGTDVTFDSAHVRRSAATETNIVAPKAIVDGDLPFLSEAQKERARERMRAIASADPTRPRRGRHLVRRPDRGRTRRPRRAGLGLALPAREREPRRAPDADGARGAAHLPAVAGRAASPNAAARSEAGRVELTRRSCRIGSFSRMLARAGAAQA